MSYWLYAGQAPALQRACSCTPYARSPPERPSCSSQVSVHQSSLSFTATQRAQQVAVRSPQCQPARRNVSVGAASSPPSNSEATRAGRQDDAHSNGHMQAFHRIAVLKASKSLSCPVEEAGRPLAEYMTLPASQYSVLDAKRIDRIDERTFRCYVDSIHFFGLIIEPILTVSVTVGERGPTVKLLDTRLEGSDAVVSANERFTATMTNVVQWTESTLDRPKEISSDTSIQVTLEIPGWMKFLPKGVLEGVGSKAMQGVLNSMVPRFLTQLQKDYTRWAAGDQSRQPVGSGQL